MYILEITYNHMTILLHLTQHKQEIWHLYQTLFCAGTSEGLGLRFVSQLFTILFLRLFSRCRILNNFQYNGTTNLYIGRRYYDYDTKSANIIIIIYNYMIVSKSYIMEEDNMIMIQISKLLEAKNLICIMHYYW